MAGPSTIFNTAEDISVVIIDLYIENSSNDVAGTTSRQTTS